MLLSTSLVFLFEGIGGSDDFEEHYRFITKKNHSVFFPRCKMMAMYSSAFKDSHC